MSPPDVFREDSPAVQAHLSMSQSVIQRMASNSASCKAWCVALVSAVLVVGADKGKPIYALFALGPALLFSALDCYYLALERMFRRSYNDFIDKLHQASIEAADLYAISPTGRLLPTALSSAGSFSVWPFYAGLAAMTIIAMSMLA